MNNINLLDNLSTKYKRRNVLVRIARKLIRAWR